MPPARKNIIVGNKFASNTSNCKTKGETANITERSYRRSDRCRHECRRRCSITVMAVTMMMTTRLGFHQIEQRQTFLMIGASSSSPALSSSSSNPNKKLPLLRYIFTQDECLSSTTSTASSTSAGTFPNHGILSRYDIIGNEDESDPRGSGKYDLLLNSFNNSNDDGDDDSYTIMRCGKEMGIEIVPLVDENDGDDHEHDPPLSMIEPIGSILSSLSSSSFLDHGNPRNNENENGQDDGHGDDFKGVVFTMWVRPTAALATSNDDNVSSTSGTSRRRPIMTIGKPKSEPDYFAGYNYCDIHSIDFQLSIDYDTKELEMIYRTSDPYFVPCQQTVTKFDDAIINESDDDTVVYHNTSVLVSSIMHLAIVLQDGRQEIFVNGRRIAMTYEPFKNDLSHWNGQSSSIHFFSTSQQATAPKTWWDGQLFQFSLYTNADSWKDQTVLNEIAEGLPISKPFAVDLTVTVQEDAKTQLSTPCVYIDREIEQIQDYWGLPHRPVPKVVMVVTSFPTKGDLFYEDMLGRGQTLSPPENSGSIEVDAFSSGQFMFLPMPDEHSLPIGSVYASFSVCAMTKTRTRFLLDKMIECDEAVFSIVVDPIHDPPVAIGPPGNYYKVKEGVEEESDAILLTGSDVDHEDYIKSIQIVKPPARGFLYVSTSEFKEGSLLHGTLLTSVDDIVPGPVALVEYKYNGYKEEAVTSDLTTDSFQFRVQDNDGLWSNIQEVELHIQSRVVVLSDSSNDYNVVTADDKSLLQFAGRDESGYNRSLGLYFGSPFHQGRLYDAYNTPIQMDSIIQLESQYEGAAHGNITFIADRELCNSEEAVSISLPYHIVALDSDGEIQSVSRLANKQFIHQCPTRSIYLETERSAYTVPAFGSPPDSACGGYLYNFSRNEIEACQNDTLLIDIKVEGEAFQPGMILVSIDSLNHAQLTIDAGSMDDLEPLYDHVQMRSNIVFLCHPWQLSHVLSKLHYQNMMVGKDEIKVTVHYGKSCMFARKQLMIGYQNTTNNMTGRCETTQIIVEVEVTENQRQQKKYLFQKFPWIPMPFTACMLLFLKLRGKSRELMIAEEEQVHNNGGPPILWTKTDTTVDETAVDDKNDEGSDVPDFDWKQHLDKRTGHYYYQNILSEDVVWDAPEESGVRILLINGTIITN